MAAGVPDTHTLADGTVAFLPHRLNRQPVVVRGLTNDELWATAIVAGVIGVLLGIPLAWLTASIATAPTTIMISIAVGIFLGGTLLRRQKRGRPETWLYRQLQWWARRRVPRLAAWVGGSDLITRSGHWTTRRGAPREGQ